MAKLMEKFRIHQKNCEKVLAPIALPTTLETNLAAKQSKYRCRLFSSSLQSWHHALCVHLRYHVVIRKIGVVPNHPLPKFYLQRYFSLP
jgi:hypothetical protein